MTRLYQSLEYASTTSSPPALSFEQSKTNKVGISFPLGTGLVVLAILLVSALFSLCYHWLTLRKLGASVLPASHSMHQLLQASRDDDTAPCKLGMLQCPPVVYMAGEDVPRFIAVPCAFEGGSRKAITAEVAHEKCVPKSPQARHSALN